MEEDEIDSESEESEEDEEDEEWQEPVSSPLSSEESAEVLADRVRSKGEIINNRENNN